MNNKLYNAIKNLNLTNEQRNTLVDVLSELGGGIKEKVFKLEFNDTIIKINGVNINYTNEDGVNVVDENTFNFIKDSMKNATDFELIVSSGENTQIFKSGVLYLYTNTSTFDVSGLFTIMEGGDISCIFTLSAYGDRYEFNAAF